ncbi:hypothetical protein BN85401910 [Alteracholeplasma palmae J233]|uniref:ParB/Sulfiredoxin domain-containing protein n=1 Tax=Alteracholeplasma palmae (strain ATCC 49389 / J233) TaxID=1318466 RepID=U4KJX4_ALTPJ|nr:hypothetical protein [Alteracholeplasma palmae]CCV63768.1 hypothetical protein BN85401910 [Alteracholeplasma palmae J233]
MAKYKTINIKDLILWENNPRISGEDKLEIEENNILSIYKQNPSNMKNIAKNIAENGLKPHDLVVVYPKNRKYIVYEGNRRIAALKCIKNPKILKDEIEGFRFFSKIAKQNKINMDVFCYVAEDYIQAMDLVRSTHTGQLNGIGRIPWGTREKDNFTRLINPEAITTASQLLHNYPNEFDTVISNIKITNATRILDNPEIKKIIGIKNKEDYNSLDSIQQSLVHDILECAIKVAKEKKASVSRYFNTSDKIKIDLAGKFINRAYVTEKKKNVITNIKLFQNNWRIHINEQFNLLENIVDLKNYEIRNIEYKILTDISKTNLSEDKISFSEKGEYRIRYEYTTEERLITAICDFSVYSRPTTIGTSEKELFDNHKSYKIDINETINNLILQVRTLNKDKHYLIISTALRSIVEGALVEMHDKYNWKNAGSLGNYIHNFKSKIIMDNKLKEKICEETNENIASINSFLEGIDPRQIAAQLNLSVHNAGVYFTKQSILDLAETTVTVILMYCSALLK